MDLTSPVTDINATNFVNLNPDSIKIKVTKKVLPPEKFDADEVKTMIGRKADKDELKLQLE